MLGMLTVVALAVAPAAPSSPGFEAMANSFAYSPNTCVALWTGNAEFRRPGLSIAANSVVVTYGRDSAGKCTQPEHGVFSGELVITRDDSVTRGADTAVLDFRSGNLDYSGGSFRIQPR